MSQELDFVQALACPFDRTSLALAGDGLRCTSGHQYPIVDGVPVLLAGAANASHSAIRRTLDALDRGETPEYWAHADDPSSKAIDPVVQRVVAATNGIMYKGLVGHLAAYPIPEFRLNGGYGKRLLDIGCNWGRWCVAAARKGYDVIGIDPDLEAVLAATRVARHLGVRTRYVVGDARVLPFRSGVFDRVFSYSVIQHFSKPDAKQSLREVARVLVPRGQSFLQMPNAAGLRSAYHIARRRGAEPKDFDVRYWRVQELRQAFEDAIGPSAIEIDGFFGLGIQATDATLLPPKYRAVVYASEGMRKLSRVFPSLVHVADSLYIRSARP